jgi:hypothetical protein
LKEEALVRSVCISVYGTIIHRAIHYLLEQITTTVQGFLHTQKKSNKTVSPYAIFIDQLYAFAERFLRSLHYLERKFARCHQNLY